MSTPAGTERIRPELGLDLSDAYCLNSPSTTTSLWEEKQTNRPFTFRALANTPACLTRTVLLSVTLVLHA
jgi:hypothetical protein